MNKLSLAIILSAGFLLSPSLMVSGSSRATAPYFSANSLRNINSGTGTQREPKAAKKARIKQEKKDKQLKKDYEKFVENNQKRSIEIQTPKVQERMKQNLKNSNANYKAKKKSNAARSKKAGRKYKR